MKAYSRRRKACDFLRVRGQSQTSVDLLIIEPLVNYNNMFFIIKENHQDPTTLSS